MATESFFSNASLAYLASAGAGKDGKAYSIKPTDGTGDFTFSRGSNLAATRVGPTGLIEKGRENLLVQSNNFSQWSTNASALTSGQTGYDGLSDAWLLTKSGANGFVYRSVSGSGIQTVSVYAKQGTNSWMQIYVVGTSNVRTYFDLGNGTLGAYAFNVIDRSIEDVGNGWYRCSVVFNNSTSQVRFFVSDGNNDDTGTSGSIYIQDAQLEIGLAASEPIESGATTGKAGLLEDEPRFDYSGGATCPSLLLEPSRTNLIPQSEPFSGGAWNIFDNATIASNYATSPEGLQNAAKIGSSGGGNDFIYDTISATIGQTYTTSFFVKNINSTRTSWWGVNVSDGQIIWNGSTISSKSGANVDYEDYGNGWYRVWQTSTATSSSPVIRFYSAYQLVGETLLYGFQVEAGSYPTSYIPNHSGGTITRGGDFFVNSNDLSSLFASNEGSFYFETDDTIFKGEDSNNNYLGFLEGSSGNYFRFRGSDTSILVQSIGYGSNISFNPSGATLTKYLYKWDGSTIKLFVDGVERGSVSQTATFNPDTFRPAGGGSFFTIKTNLKQMIAFPTALSDADCISLTTL